MSAMMAANREPSPSEIALRAVREKPPVGYPASADGRCALCGVHYGKGEPVMPFERDKSFTDWASMAHPGSRTTCIWCAGVMMGQSWRLFMQNFQKTIICEKGVFQAASKDHLAWWFLNPPAGDWLFVQGDKRMQHLVWRTPVNRSTEIYQVRYNEVVMTIRRQRLADGRDAAKRLTSALNEFERAEGKRGAPSRGPFASLSPDLDATDQGRLKLPLYALAAQDPRVAADVATVRALTGGERWALYALLYAEDPRPSPALTVPGHRSSI